MHVNYKGTPYTPQEIDRFDSAIKRECGIKASALVQELKVKGTLGRIVTQQTADPEVAKLLDEAFQEIIKELRSQ